MVCRPVKRLIFWLLVTSPSVHGNITRSAADFTSSLEISSYRPESRQSNTSPVPEHPSTASPLGTSSEDDDDYALLSTTNINDDDKDNDNNDNKTSSSSSSPSSSYLPIHLRGEGLVTSEEYESVSYIIKIITAPITLVGLFTNFLTILVYLRKPKSVTSTFFTLATGLDVVFLLSGLPPILTYLVLGEGGAMRNVFYVKYALYVNNYVTNTLRKLIVCVTMMLSLDRYLMVSLPLRMKKYDHLRRPKLYTLIVAILVFLLDTNVLFRFMVIEASSSSSSSSSSQNGTGTTQLRLQTTDTYMARQQMFFDISLTSSFVFQYIPLTVLVVSNILLVVTLARHSRQMKFRLDTDVVGGAPGKGQGQNLSLEHRTVKTKLDFFFSYSENRSVEKLGDSSDCQEGGQDKNLSEGRGQDRNQVEGQGQDQNKIKDQGHDRVCNSVSSQDQNRVKDQGQSRVRSTVTSSSVACHRRVMSVVKSERQHSVMVLVYSFIFTLLALPNTLYPLLRKIIPGFSPLDRQHFLVLSLMSMYLLLDTISSAVNFFVCFLTGSAFRAGVFALFATRRRLN